MVELEFIILLTITLFGNFAVLTFAYEFLGKVFQRDKKQKICLFIILVWGMVFFSVILIWLSYKPYIVLFQVVFVE